MLRLSVLVCATSVCAVVASQCQSMGASLSDADMSGDLLAEVWAASVDECCPLCRERDGCEGFAFFENRCYMKANFTGTYHQVGVTTRVASSVLGQGCPNFGPVQQDRDLAGTLLEDWYAPTSDLCCVSCSRKSECQGFAFLNSRCYLKGDVTGTYENTGCIVHLKDNVDLPRSTPSTTPAPTSETAQPGGDTPKCPDFSVEAADTDIAGDLLSERWAQTSDDCCPLCSAIEGCQGFAFFHHLCYLKGNFSGTYHQAGVVSRWSTTAPVSGGCPGYAPVYQDRDLAGTLLEHWFASSVELCCAACAKNAECQGFAFVGSHCYLKGNVVGTYEHLGSITRVKHGVLPEPSSCPEFEPEAADTDMSGDLITQSWAATSDGCCTLCQEVAACDGYVYLDHTCYLKKNFTGAYHHLGAVTRIVTRAVRQEVFAPTQPDHDLAGKLLEEWFAPLPELCMASCAQKPDCEGFAFHDNRCYLKADVEGTYENLGCIAGVRSGALPSGGRRLSDNNVMVV